MLQNYGELLQENLKLKDEKKRLETALLNKEIGTAELYISFGKQSEEWLNTMKKVQEGNKEITDAMVQLKREIGDKQKKMAEDMEEIQKNNKNLLDKEENNRKTIAGMRRDIEELQTENGELKKEVKDLEEALIAHDNDQRERRQTGLHLGEIAYKIERLTAIIILADVTREEDRQILTYNLKLKNVRKRVSSLQNEEVKKRITGKIEKLPPILFEQWFVQLVEEIKDDCKGVRTRRTLGGYEETKKLVKDHCKDNKEKCAHMLIMVDSLKELYDHLGLSFGEKDDSLHKKSSRTSKRLVAQESCEKQSKKQKKH